MSERKTECPGHSGRLLTDFLVFMLLAQILTTIYPHDPWHGRLALVLCVVCGIRLICHSLGWLGRKAGAKLDKEERRLRRQAR